MIYRYKTAAGTAISVLSNLSNRPPCPGSIFPESLMPILRFIRDSTRSPHVPNTTTVNASPIHWDSESRGKYLEITIAAIMLNTHPPNEPSHDFLGDMRSKSLCFPNSTPAQYAPVSFTHVKMNIERGNIGL